MREAMAPRHANRRGQTDMHCTINGKPVAIPTRMTLGDYLESSGFPKQGLVVERNGAIVGLGEWSTTLLEDNDHVEIITFVAGG